uniref:HNH nuclease domain-containing protein n=1 Tax=Oedocladium carolinianum TaxID=55992 RepID=A0A8K1JAE4_9CHLO|nr:hypothetical protein [Oedocladium carolinianum]
MLTLGAQVKIHVILNPMSNTSKITWNDIDWGKTQEFVRKVQHRIYRARLQGDLGRVHWLQKYLINSKGAKLLSVRQVTTLNKRKKTPGIDKQIIKTPEDKLKLAEDLTLDGKATYIRRVWIPKPGKIEKRPLGIPTIQDRAKQALAKLALEPEWEAIFEPNSYGFRPGRSALDAIEAIFLSLHHNKSKFIYDADIRKCFDTIDHNALLTKLNTFPLMKRQIAAWLKSGVMEGYANNPKYEVQMTTEGTPQGGVISPLLANIALHGIENHLKEYVGNLSIKPHPESNRGKAAKQKALSVIRYADDFVLIHQNEEILELCISETKNWLKQIGLVISEEKSFLRDGINGFQFLGFSITQVKKVIKDKYKVKITPSRSAQKKLLLKIRAIIQNNKAASSYDLILMLRPIIIGWANYFKYCECKEVFNKLSNLIFKKLRAWAFRRDTKHGRKHIKEKYFPSGKTYKFDDHKHMNNWVFVGSKKTQNNMVKQIYLPHLSWICKRKHVKIKGNETPYSRSHYWAIRNITYSPYPLRIRQLLVRQKQICPICKRHLTTLDASNWEVDHIIPKVAGGLDAYNNLQLLHKECHLKKTQKDLLKYQPKNKTNKPNK